MYDGAGGRRRRIITCKDEKKQLNQQKHQIDRKDMCQHKIERNCIPEPDGQTMIWGVRKDRLIVCVTLTRIQTSCWWQKLCAETKRARGTDMLKECFAMKMFASNMNIPKFLTMPIISF